MQLCLNSVEVEKAISSGSTVCTAWISCSKCHSAGMKSNHQWHRQTVGLSMRHSYYRFKAMSNGCFKVSWGQRMQSVMFKNIQTPE